MPHLPTITEKEPKEEPETEIEPKFQPEIPEFEPDFQLPNSPDSTTPESLHPSPFNLSKILPQPLSGICKCLTSGSGKDSVDT